MVTAKEIFELLKKGATTEAQAETSAGLCAMHADFHVRRRQRVSRPLGLAEVQAQRGANRAQVAGRR